MTTKPSSRLAITYLTVVEADGNIGGRELDHLFIITEGSRSAIRKMDHDDKFSYAKKMEYNHEGKKGLEVVPQEALCIDLGQQGVVLILGVGGGVQPHSIGAGADGHLR